MAAPVNNTLPPPMNDSGRRVVIAAEEKLSVAAPAADTAAGTNADQIDLSGAALRLGRVTGGSAGAIATPQAAAMALVNLRRQISDDPAAALAAYGKIQREGMLPASLA